MTKQCLRCSEFVAQHYFVFLFSHSGLLASSNLIGPALTEIEAIFRDAGTQ
jgi:hypothetical protein